MFKDQGGRQISEQAAEEAVQRTNAIFSDLNIKQDSLVHQYKYAIKGFAAKLTEEQVRQLEQDPRVETVVQDVKYKAIQAFPAAASNETISKLSDTVPWGG